MHVLLRNSQISILMLPRLTEFILETLELFILPE